VGELANIVECRIFARCCSRTSVAATSITAASCHYAELLESSRAVKSALTDAADGYVPGTGAGEGVGDGAGVCVFAGTQEISKGDEHADSEQASASK
jgi:hypothetical protein